MAYIWFFSHKWFKFCITCLKFCIETAFGIAHERKKRFDKFLNILPVNGKSSKNQKSKFCKNLQKELFLGRFFKNFHTLLETNLQMHIYLCTKFGGTSITVRLKNTLKSLKKWVQKYCNSCYLGTLQVAMAKRFKPSAQNFAHQSLGIKRVSMPNFSLQIKFQVRFFGSSFLLKSQKMPIFNVFWLSNA